MEITNKIDKYLKEISGDVPIEKIPSLIWLKDKKSKSELKTKIGLKTANCCASCLSASEGYEGEWSCDNSQMLKLIDFDGEEIETEPDFICKFFRMA